MSDKLTEIMAWKRREIAPLLRAVSDAELARLDASLPRPPSFAAALRRPDGRLAVIAEIKRRSPSAGDIKAGASSVDQAARYQAAGAIAAGLDALFEIHTEPEIARALAHGARIIGVNNRDLAIFKTDLGLSERLIPLFPSHVTAVSESGLHTAADAARVRAAGAHAVLVGESLMKAPDPTALIAAFRSP